MQLSLANLDCVDPACPINPDHPLNNGLVSEWAVVPNSGWRGGLTFQDLVRGWKKPNDGTLTNGPTWQGAKGRPGGFGCLSFNGTNNLVQVADSSSYRPTGASTIAFWQKGSSSSGGACTIGQLGISGSRGFSLGDKGDAVNFSYQIAADASTLFSTSGGTNDKSKWFHVCGVFIPSTGVYLYVNGLLVSSNTSSPPASQYQGNGLGLQIGARGDSTQFWLGLCDDVCILSGALSGGEVFALYQESVQGNPNRWNWISTTRYFLPVIQGTTYDKTLSDGCLSGDTSRGYGTFTRTTFDGNVSSDTNRGYGTFTKLTTDGSVSSDTESVLKTLVELITDGGVSGNTFAATATFTRTLTDGSVSSDTESVLKTLTSVITDGAKSGDTETKTLLILAILSDGVKSGDSVVGNCTFTRTVIEGGTSSDTVSLGPTTYDVLLSDGTKGGDTVRGTATFTRTVTDGSVSGDTETVRKTLTLVLTDGLKSGDTSIATGTFTRTTSDGGVAGNTFSFGPATYDVLMSDGGRSGDVEAGNIVMTSTVTDGSKAGDTLIANGTFNQSIHDGILSHMTRLGFITSILQLHEGTVISSRVSVQGGAQLNIEPVVKWRVGDLINLRFDTRSPVNLRFSVT